MAGGSSRLVARVHPYDIALAFSPDGTQLTYSSAAGVSTTAVDRIAPRTIPLPRAWRGSRFNHLAYERDGRRLVLSRTAGDGRKGTLVNELVVLDLASGAGRPLLRSANPYDMRVRPASFSPTAPSSPSTAPAASPSCPPAPECRASCRSGARTATTTLRSSRPTGS